jgi:hypothetical protein
MAKRPAAIGAADRESDPLACSVDRLANEIAALRQVIDEIREDFSWVTRNGMPVQPIEHVHVKRMALDPCAADWGEHLDIERSRFPADAEASPLTADALDRIADDLKATFEAAAQGQLEIVLTALDGVRVEIIATLKRRQPTSDTATETTAPATASPPRATPPPGHLF